jgi:CRP-like cAMP-binding protein
MVDAQARDRAAAGTIDGRERLTVVVPELAGFVAPDERAVIAQITVPVLSVAQGTIDLHELLESRSAFAAAVIDGIVLYYLAIGGEPSMSIIGPGDLILGPSGPDPEVVSPTRYRVASATRIALLGNEFLLAASRAPRTIVGLVDALAQQSRRVSAQLAVCQLPRVADRVHAMLWLLAESVGRVTPSGTRLPLSLTHEAIGALVGARRPTVTLALGELAKRGAVVAQDSGWLLLEPPPATPPEARAPIRDEPQLLDREPAGWAESRQPARGGEELLAALIETVTRLDRQHRQNIERYGARIARAKRSRERTAAVRARARRSRERSSALRRRRSAQGRVSRQPPPSA